MDFLPSPASNTDCTRHFGPVYPALSSCHRAQSQRFDCTLHLQPRQLVCRYRDFVHVLPPECFSPLQHDIVRRCLVLPLHPVVFIGVPLHSPTMISDSKFCHTPHTLTMSQPRLQPRFTKALSRLPSSSTTSQHFVVMRSHSLSPLRVRHSCQGQC